MADTLTPEQRKKCMSAVHNKNTDIEIQLRKALWGVGLRYRIKSKLLGKPDIVFPRKKLVIFVDGCFWHGCPIHGTSPKTNADFWETKIRGNIARDKKVTNQLALDGWLVMRFWEHEIKENIDIVVKTIATKLPSCPSGKT